MLRNITKYYDITPYILGVIAGFSLRGRFFANNNPLEASLSDSESWSFLLFRKCYEISGVVTKYYEMFWDVTKCYEIPWASPSGAPALRISA